MSFKEWWEKNGQYMNCYGDAHLTWRDALTSCAEMLEKEAAKLAETFATTDSTVVTRIDAKTRHNALLNAAILIRTEIANS